jgi:hypothetical protein
MKDFILVVICRLHEEGVGYVIRYLTVNQFFFHSFRNLGITMHLNMQSNPTQECQDMACPSLLFTKMLGKHPNISTVVVLAKTDSKGSVNVPRLNLHYGTIYLEPMDFDNTRSGEVT